MGGADWRLHDLNTGQALWSRRPGESVGTRSLRRSFIKAPGDSVRATKLNDSFLVEEHWTFPWLDIDLDRFATVAVRDMGTGRVRHRFWERDSPALCLEDAEGTLAANERGVVRRLPLQVNCPLLALCQTILALPLVLLWEVLRWRRKRRMGMASVAP